MSDQSSSAFFSLTQAEYAAGTLTVYYVLRRKNKSWIISYFSNSNFGQATSEGKSLSVI
jgi:hypothetical protein